MKLFLIQPTSILYFTFQSFFPAQGEKWVVGCVEICWLGLSRDKLEHCPVIECKRMVGSALKVDENTHPWLPETQTLLLLKSFLWVLGRESSRARGCSCPVVEPSGNINRIVALVRSSWLLGVSCHVPVQVLGIGGTKVDWEKELENMEKVLSTTSSGSTPATFGCTCGYCVFLGNAQVWHWPAVLVSIWICVKGQTPFLPAWSLLSLLGVCAGIEPCCCSVGCGSGVCTWGTWLGKQFLHRCVPFLKSGFIFLQRAPKPGCGWPSCDSIWEVKGFLAFPFAETSPPAVCLLSALAVLKPSPFPPWPSSWAWSYSSGEPCVPARWEVLFLSYLKWS